MTREYNLSKYEPVSRGVNYSASYVGNSGRYMAQEAYEKVIKYSPLLRKPEGDYITCSSGRDLITVPNHIHTSEKL